MSGRDYAFLDLAALPAVGSALLAPQPTVLFAADGSRILLANAAGAAFFAERRLEPLLDRRFSSALPATEQIARVGRALPPGGRRLERIRFAVGAGLASIAAECMRIALPDGEDAVLVQLPQRGRASMDLDDAARQLVGLLAADDCLVAVLAADGAVLADSGDIELVAAGEAAIGELVAALARSGGRLIKRAVRIGDARRPSGLAAIEAGGRRVHLLVIGPGERVVLEPVDAEQSKEPGPRRHPVADPVTAEAAPPEREPDLPVPAADAAALPTSGPDIAETPAAGLRAAGPVAAAPEPEAEGFRFIEPTGPVRFVFQMDAAGRFRFVSPDFAERVGPRSAIAIGESWSGMATRLGLDPTGAVASLIARRDTWSGVSLDWPVDGSDRMVAVDLAALPAFSRERSFEGYRGFGVIRPAERRDGAAAPPPRPSAGPGDTPSGAPSNIIRLARPGSVPDSERLSAPEQDAFRRIAAALGAPAAGAPAPTEPRSALAPADLAPADMPPAAVQEASPEAASPSPPPAEAAEEQPAPGLASAGDTVPASLLPLPPAGPEPGMAEPKAEPPTVARAEPADMTVDAKPREDDRPPEDEAVARQQPAADDRAVEVELASIRRRIVELEAILDTATDGVIVVDDEARIERINRSAEALFGVDSAAVAGLRLPDLLAEESRQSALDYLDGLARNGVASVLNDGREVIGRVPQGGLIPLFMTMGRLPETGKFCAVLRDITQWKNAEGELINARRAAESASLQKSDFLAKVSHEIRTPLNAIIGFSEVMMEERFGPIGTERYKEYLRDIHLSGAHLMSLLNDLLDLSKIEAGKLDLTFESVMLNEIVMECVALMQPQANRERIIIRTSLSGQVPNVVADPRSIRQIVLNLVSNAVKFTLAGGQVIVSTAMETHGEVSLRIRDTGIGMSASDIETALKPFRQLSTSRERRSDGTGLGLPLTKALVEANRAAFAIDSAVGQGTLIRITFPATRVLAS